MSLYFIFVFIHILSAICWTGYTLYWFFIISPIKKEFDNNTGKNLIRQVTNAKWPPGTKSVPLKLSIAGLGWICIAALICTGFVMLFVRGFTIKEIASGQIFFEGLGLLGIGKLFLVTIMLYLEFFVKERSVVQSRIVFLLTLFIAGISVMLVR